MKISNFLTYNKFIVCGLLIPLGFFLLHDQAVAHARYEDDLRVANVDWKVQGDIIVITYDVTGGGSDPVLVKVTLLNEIDPTVKIVPQSITGDIGEGYFNGTGRTVRWDYLKDVPNGLQGEGYYFDITAENAGGGMPWLYIAAGAAVVGGAVLLAGSKKSDGGGGGGTPLSDLPLPPGTRPPQ